MKKALARKESRFVIAGAFNTVIGLATYPFLYYVIGANYILTLLVSQAICITLAFLTNKYFVFRTKGSLVHEYLKFVWFHGIYLILNLFALPLLVEEVGMNPVLAQTCFAVAVIISSYFWHNKITFSKQTTQNGG